MLPPQEGLMRLLLLLHPPQQLCACLFGGHEEKEEEGQSISRVEMGACSHHAPPQTFHSALPFCALVLGSHPASKAGQIS